tara:strand:+ start:828 stop:3281 length:2454 start_codon:yes stop_codon:yes gene_type:complete
MGVVSRAIPTLLRGISQSADATKQADHADIQDNANSNPVQGLTKRSGTQFLANISNSTVGNVHIQTINRDLAERYVAVFSNGNVKVYELDGTELTVNKPDGTNYLNTSNPRDQIKTVTIADFTFVVNTSITTAMDSALSAGNITQAIVFINQVSDKTTYTVTVDGTTATKDTSSDDPLSTTAVATALKNGLNSGLSGFTIAQNGAVLHIKKNDGSNFSIDGNDTQGNTHITIVKDSVQRFTDLPTVSPNGYVVEIKGDESTNFDNYYVKFVTNNGGALEEGQWEETLESGIQFKFNYDTMPHVLIRQADGNFRFARVDGDTYTISGTDFTLPKWGERTVGDVESAPNPSFIGTKINNVFFFRNRLGFLADDNVVLSRVSEFFNFFPETVLTVIDSDPIDVAASHTKVAILKSAVTMGEQLILFSDQTQFVMASSSDTFTPKTANVIVATEFESSDSAQPVGSGSSIYYLTDKGDFAGVREYITQEKVAIKDAANITIHVPRLIPKNIFKFAVSTNEDVLILLGSDEPNKLYVNRWLEGERGKILNSWSTYTFNTNRTIRNIDFIGNELFMVVEEANGTTLEKMPFAADFVETNATFEFHLDHKVTEATTGVSVSYNAGTDVTTFTVPYRLRKKMTVVGRYLASGETSTFVDTQGITKELKAGQVLLTNNSVNGSTNTITINGDFRNSKFIIGEPYEMHYRFSKQRLTESAGGQASGEIISGRLQLHHFYIKFEDTGFFKVQVTPENRDTSEHEFTGKFLGAASAAIGQINLESGTFRFPIMTRADKVDIDVKNDTFLPTQLSSAEYEAMFYMRSRRI